MSGCDTLLARCRAVLAALGTNEATRTGKQWKHVRREMIALLAGKRT